MVNLKGQGDVWFDKVVMAAHADQSLALIDDASPLERELLGAFGFQHNHAVLHSDASLMPKRRGAWAAWNYVSEAAAPASYGVAGSSGQGESSPPSDLCLTYWMNRLQ